MSETRANPEYDEEDAMRYLLTGGLGEVIGLADMARNMNWPKVQMNTDMAMALCTLAGRGHQEALCALTPTPEAP